MGKVARGVNLVGKSYSVDVFSVVVASLDTLVSLQGVLECGYVEELLCWSI